MLARKRPRAKKKVFMAEDLMDTDAASHESFQMVERSTYEMVADGQLLKERYSCMLEPTAEFAVQKQVLKAAHAALQAAYAAVGFATSASATVKEIASTQRCAVRDALRASMGAAAAADHISRSIEASVAAASAAQIAHAAAAAGLKRAHDAWLMLTDREFQIEIYERNHAAEAIQAQLRRRQALMMLRETLKKVEVVARMRLAKRRKEEARLAKVREEEEEADRGKHAQQEVDRRRKGASARAQWKRAQKHAKQEVEERLCKSKDRSKSRRERKQKEAGDAILHVLQAAKEQQQRQVTAHNRSWARKNAKWAGQNGMISC
jgi:hypothetical protein